MINQEEKNAFLRSAAVKLEEKRTTQVVVRSQGKTSGQEDFTMVMEEYKRKRLEIEKILLQCEEAKRRILRGEEFTKVQKQLQEKEIQARKREKQRFGYIIIAGICIVVLLIAGMIFAQKMRMSELDGQPSEQENQTEENDAYYENSDIINCKCDILSYGLPEVYKYQKEKVDDIMGEQEIFYYMTEEDARMNTKDDRSYIMIRLEAEYYAEDMEFPEDSIQARRLQVCSLDAIQYQLDYGYASEKCTKFICDGKLITMLIGTEHLSEKEIELYDKMINSITIDEKYIMETKNRNEKLVSKEALIAEREQEKNYLDGFDCLTYKVPKHMTNSYPNLLGGSTSVSIENEDGSEKEYFEIGIRFNETDAQRGRGYFFGERKFAKEESVEVDSMKVTKCWLNAEDNIYSDASNSKIFIETIYKGRYIMISYIVKKDAISKKDEAVFDAFIKTVKFE